LAHMANGRRDDAPWRGKTPYANVRNTVFRLAYKYPKPQESQERRL
jgi:hypothetical protein